jgi:hypothetical protein
MLTIVFSEGKTDNPILKLFRPIFHKYRSTHVSFGIEVNDKPYIFHMSYKGAIRTRRDRFLVKNDIVKEYRILPDLSDELMTHLQYLGKAKYNHVSAFIHMITLIFHPLKMLLIFLHIKNMFYCANFARQLDSHDKVKAWRKIDKRWASIDELQAACEASPEFEDITSCSSTSSSVCHPCSCKHGTPPPKAHHTSSNTS